MAHQFENPSVSNRTSDVMTDAEVNEVLARLHDQKISPSVQDVASISGASEDEVRRVLEEVRREQNPVAPEVVPVAPSVSYDSVAIYSRSPRTTRLALIAVIFLGLGLLMMMRFSAQTVAATPPPAPVATEVTKTAAGTGMSVNDASR